MVERTRREVAAALVRALAGPLGMLALVASLVSCSGGTDLSGEWDLAVSIEGETAVGEMSLTQNNEDRLSGTGQLAYGDDSRAISVRGGLSEEGETVTLEDDAGVFRLQGDVSGNGRSLTGTAVGTGAEEAGYFSAVRTNGASEAGSGERDPQVQEAVSDYLRARSVDSGTGGSEYLARIEETVVAPPYWSSPAGQQAREFAAELGQGDGEAATSTLELVDFVADEEGEREATGTIRYSQKYEADGDSGTYSGAVGARVVRWDDGWRVLWAGESSQDPWTGLVGTWRAAVEGEDEYFANPEYSQLAPGAADGFELTIDSVRSVGDGSYELAGTAEGVFEGSAEVTGDAIASDDGFLSVGMVVEPNGEPEFAKVLDLNEIVVPGDGTMEGSALDTTAAVIGTPEADFSATRSSSGG